MTPSEAKKIRRMKNHFLYVQEDYPRGWKLVQITVVKPKGFWNWVNYLGGLDIWVGRIPLLKLEIALFILNILIY